MTDGGGGCQGTARRPWGQQSAADPPGWRLPWGVRWLVVLACAGCGRLAFDERVPPDVPVVPDGPEIRCTTEAFDELPPEFDQNGNGDISIVDGKIVFAIDGVLNSEAFLQHTSTSSFVGRSIAIEVVAPSRTQSASTAIGWHEQTGDLVGIHLEYDGFSLKLNRYNPTLDQYDELVTMPYDDVEFAWWRMRDGGAGDIVAEVSRDGVAWNLFGTVPATDLTNMKWDMGLGSYVGNVAPSETTLDNAIDCVP